MTFAYPVFLNVEGISTLVVGGGHVAARKAQGLIDAGALVTVIAPAVVAELEAVATRVERRAYQPGEAAEYQLVITATSDRDVNALVAADARAAGVWVNSADDPVNCSFILPAIARRGSVRVAVSTDGTSPALASRLRDTIAANVLTEQVERAAIELARQRTAIHDEGASTESIDWRKRLDALLTEGDRPNRPD